MPMTSLLSKKRTELMRMAKHLGLRGISTLKKEELAARITRAQQERNAPRRGTKTATAKPADAIKRRAVRRRTAKTASATKTKATAKTSSRTTTKKKKKKTKKKAKITTRAKSKMRSATKTTRKPTPRRSAAATTRARTDTVGGAGDVSRGLPESYGTGRMYLTARDPHWLYSYWDLSQEQMDAYRGQAADNQLVLRVRQKDQAGTVQEIVLQEDSRNWYIYVNQAATTYTAELGYRPRRGSFRIVCRSAEATTPPEMIAPDQAAQFVTIPVDIPFGEIQGMVRDHLQEGESLAAGLQRLETHGAPRFGRHQSPEPWSEEQARVVSGRVWENLLRRTQSGSVEISEWLRRRLSEELSSGVFSGAGFSPTSGSWQVRDESRAGFWFAVNAELTIYGATEPGATVTVDGRPIQLRPDGTFSFHYVFPDGSHRLPVVAVAADGQDERAVELKFERRTEVDDEVGAVPQPGDLKAPSTA